MTQAHLDHNSLEIPLRLDGHHFVDVGIDTALPSLGRICETDFGRDICELV